MKHVATAILIVTVLLGGCTGNTSTPVTPSLPAVPSLVLQTEIGPVDVLSFDEKDGGRRITVHRVQRTGEHVLRDIKVRERWVPETPGVREFTAEVMASGRPTFRWTRRAREGVPRHLDMILETEDESLSVGMRPIKEQVHILIEHRTRETTRHREIRVLAWRLADPDWIQSRRQELEAFYPTGAILDHPDRALLVAVLQSPDWPAVLTAKSRPDPETQKRIQEVCVSASTLSLISCTAAPFIPLAWLVCVPASGTQIACLAYQIRQVFLTDDEGLCPCPCICTEAPPSIKE